jgi:hypothetical protein
MSAPAHPRDARSGVSDSVAVEYERFLALYRSPTTALLATRMADQLVLAMAHERLPEEARRAASPTRCRGATV